MSFVYKIVFISLITLLLSTSLVTTKVTQSDVDLCKTRDQFNVIHATNVGPIWLLMIVRLQSSSNGVDHYEYQVLRTIYQVKDDFNRRRFEAQRIHDLDKYFKDIETIKYLFELEYSDDSGSIENPNPYPSKFNVYWSQNDIQRTTSGVGLFHIHAEGPQNPYPEWSVVEDQWKYNETEDLSEYLNLKLLYRYFPKEVEILDIMIINFKEIHKLVKNYQLLALVYTSEKQRDGSHFYARYYMRGMEQKYHNSKGKEQYLRVNWTMKWEWDQKCTKVDKKIYSVAQLMWTSKNNELRLLFAEFYEHNYQEYELVIPSNETNETIKSGRNRFYIDEVYSEGIHILDKLLNCPNFDEHPVPNTTLINVETKSYNESSCPKDYTIVDINVMSSALFDHKWLVFLGTVNYKNKKGKPESTGYMLMTVRYIDTSYSMDTQFYEFDVLTQSQYVNPFDKVLKKDSNYLDNIIYLFDFDAENQVTFNVGTDGTLVTQENMNLIYWSRKNKENKNIVEVLAMEMVYDMDGTSPYNFNVRNHKMVFSTKEGADDKSGLLNMKLLLMHFPNGTHIEAVVIFRRAMGDNQVSKYNAFVYTEEAAENGTKLFMRHYMRGTPTHFQSVDIDYYRMSWEFDFEVDSCDELKNGLTAVSTLFEIPTPTGITFKVIEFFGTTHRLIEVVFKNKTRNKFEIIDNEQWEHLKPNTDLYKCNTRPNPSYSVDDLSDCYSNEKLRSDYRREGDLWKGEHPHMKPKQSIESDSILFWKMVINIALVIAIIALIAFGVYLRSVELKLD